MASKHAEEQITIGDFLRAAARGQITLRAIIRRTAKLEQTGGGVYCNAGMQNENTAPEGAILNLPLTACQQLTNVGQASWRTFDGFEEYEGALCRYEAARLLHFEPDFETVPTDCRVTGYDVRALADEICNSPETQAKSAPSSDPADTNAKSALQLSNAGQDKTLDLSILADPGQLIDAFGRYTNMDKSWFDKWADNPVLNNAIMRKGTSGRGHTTEPLFCPFLVMQGLMTKPRKGSKRKPFLNDETPWRMLKRHFAPVYDLHRGESPLDD